MKALRHLPGNGSTVEIMIKAPRPLGRIRIGAVICSSTDGTVTMGARLVSQSHSFRTDVLVDTEEVIWIIPGFDLLQPLVIVAVGGPNSRLALFHHEVDVRPIGRMRMQCLPVVANPLADLHFSAESGSMPAMTIDLLASRCRQAVSLSSTR